MYSTVRTSSPLPRLVVFLLTLLFAPPGLGAEDPFAELDAKVHRHGLLWRIDGPGGRRPSYVFGTMHVEDPRVVKLAAPVEEAFSKAGRVCTETRLDYEAVAAQLQMLFFTDGRTLRAVAGERLYARTVAVAARHGLPEALVNNTKPVAMAFMLSMPPEQSGEVLDAVLYGRALREGKEVCGLETPQEQLRALDGLSMEHQLELLGTTVAHYDELQQMLDALLGVYLDRDLAALVELARESPWEDAGEAGRAFMRRLVLERNRRMVERMLPLLQEGGAFIAVGALHLPGRGGILQALERRGWTVTRAW